MCTFHKETADSHSKRMPYFPSYLLPKAPAFPYLKIQCHSLLDDIQSSLKSMGMLEKCNLGPISSYLELGVYESYPVQAAE